MCERDRTREFSFQTKTSGYIKREQIACACFALITKMPNGYQKLLRYRIFMSARRRNMPKNEWCGGRNEKEEHY